MLDLQENLHAAWTAVTNADQYDGQRQKRRRDEGTCTTWDRSTDTLPGLTVCAACTARTMLPDESAPGERQPHMPTRTRHVTAKAAQNRGPPDITSRSPDRTAQSTDGTAN